MRKSIASLSVLIALSLSGVTPNEVPGQSDSARIEAAIAQAISDCTNEVRIPRHNLRTGEDIWLIERAIVVPSNLRLVLDDCLVRLAPGTQDNIIRNSGTTVTPMQGNSNIVVTGIGSATLSGGLQAHFDPPGDKSGWRTIGVLLFNTTNYELSNFALEETQAWGISMENGCKHGRVANITFRNTNKYPNQDGVNVRKGCSHILIENISGTTGDDSVALTGLRGSLDGSVTGRMQVGDAYPAASDDIHDIVVRNIRTFVAGGHHTVRLLNHDGIKLYNVAISDVYDQSLPPQKRPRAGIKIGDVGYWRMEPNQLGETYNIFVTNLHSRAQSAVFIQGTLKDAILCNLRPFDGAAPIEVGSMPTQNVAICEYTPPATPTTVRLDNAIFEADITPGGCDHLKVNGNLIINNQSRVEIVSADEELLKESRATPQMFCTWTGSREGNFERRTNRANWYVRADDSGRRLLLEYHAPATLLTIM